MQRHPSSPAVRLDTSAAVAGEVVAALRQGTTYMLPIGDRRLLAAVKHQLDFLGVQRAASSRGPAYVVVPAYDLTVSSANPRSYGLLMYSSASRGWANRAGNDDPRPAFLKVNEYETPEGMDSLACVIRSGEDVIYVFKCGGNSRSATALTAATLKSSSCHPPNCEFTEICDSALASAKDKLYMLGGEILCGASEAATPLRIYKPRIDSWFDAQPPSSTNWVTNSALGILLSIGGYSGTCGMIAELEGTAPMSDRLAMLDINSGRWTNNPSGCTWPGAAQTGPRRTEPSLSATAYDEYNIMVVTGVHRQQARVDVLDLRTWRWREGISQLQRPGTYAQGVGIVAFEGKVLAIGGERVQESEQQADEGEQDEQQQHEEDMESTDTKTGVRDVYSYDPATNAWSSDAVARLPFGVTRASAVVARVSA
ncbi:hypothetical protein COO60DRAFT_1641912 [Scenedesmus sp. NREL 46B-D3]|nr:hypothetical protein COO60DRAFT_1641912 [Scenedesmus sp. NREL 46B-D3]